MSSLGPWQVSETPVRLVCLDMAGTTVADGGTVEAAFIQAMASVGVAPESPAMADALAYARRTMGRAKLAVFHELLGDVARAEEANVAFEAAYDARVRAGDVAALPGAEEAMAAFRHAGMRVCLTTGFSVTTRDLIIATLGWQSRVDLALSPSDAGRGRPWPDMNLTAVLRLGIDSVREMAVAGDTTSDLWAGWRAGAGVVAGVLTGVHSSAELVSAPHTHVLPSVAELADLLLGQD